MPARFLGVLSVPRIGFRPFVLIGLALIASLGLSAAGIQSRACIFLALIAYFFYFSQIHPLADIRRKTNLIPFILIVLILSPNLNAPFHDAAPIWPLWLIQLLIAQVYFSSGYQKLRHSGLKWADGKNLQAYLLHRYLWGDMTRALSLARRPTLCRVASVCILTFELTFWLILVFPVLIPVYAIVDLGFHWATSYTMRIRYWKYFGPAYLVFTTHLGFKLLGVLP